MRWTKNEFLWVLFRGLGNCRIAFVRTRGMLLYVDTWCFRLSLRGTARFAIPLSTRIAAALCLDSTYALLKRDDDPHSLFANFGPSVLCMLRWLISCYPVPYIEVQAKIQIPLGSDAAAYDAAYACFQLGVRLEYTHFKFEPTGVILRRDCRSLDLRVQETDMMPEVITALLATDRIEQTFVYGSCLKFIDNNYAANTAAVLAAMQTLRVPPARLICLHVMEFTIDEASGDVCIDFTPAEFDVLLPNTMYCLNPQSSEP